MTPRTIAALALLALAPSAHTQEEAFSLDHFKRTGQVVIAHREASIGFSYTTRDDRPAGYSVDVCNRIAERLGRHLGIRDLRVRYAKATALTRFLLVKGKHADLECGNTTHTVDRQRDFLFSNTIATSSSRLIALKESGLRDVEDLRGKRLAVIAETTDAATARRFVAARGLDVEIVPMRNNLRAYQAVMDGKVAAFFGTEAALRGEAVRRGAQDRLAVIPGLEVEENLAVMMAKDRPALKEFVDRQIAEMARSGELARLHERWFLKPLPHFEVALGMPMSASTKAALAHPNDTPTVEPEFARP